MSTVKAWQDAADRLGIAVVAPFTISGPKHSIVCIAFLPDFGSKNGMVIGHADSPAFEMDPLLAECARSLEMYYSFVNLDQYSTFNAGVFKEALADWGYFGAAERRPAWLPADQSA
jgi:hypothetical protein